MGRGELVFRGFCVLFFAALLPYAWQFGGIRRFGEVGSGFWPLWVLAFATVLSLFLFLQGLWSARRESRQKAAAQPTSAGARRCLGAMAIVLAYLLILPRAGFVITTPAFILVFMLGLGERRVGILSAAPVLITIGLFLFFIKFIQIPLPRGSGVFLTFSRMLY